MAKKQTQMQKAPEMRTRQTPLEYPRTIRQLHMRGTSTTPVGKMHPVRAFQIFREDGITRSQFRVTGLMAETAEVLMNGLEMTVHAYFVPWAAMPQFDGLDDYERAYHGEPKYSGGPVVPFFNSYEMPAYASREFEKAIGLHAPDGTTVNEQYLNAYNLIWNKRARDRSGSITLRNADDGTIAPAFWDHRQLDNIVPDVDALAIDGNVPLVLNDAQLPVVGITRTGTVETGAAAAAGGLVSSTKVNFYRSNTTSGGVEFALPYNAPSEIYAEMSDGGMSVSLAALDQAKKTRAFAALRKQYEGKPYGDEYLLDALMSGFRIPDQAYREPILLASQRVGFGFSPRYATEADNLDAKAVEGAAMVDMTIRIPTQVCGGVVMIVAEVVPPQMWERAIDPGFRDTSVANLPDAMRDFLDPEQVDFVANGDIDSDHGTPAGLFGYAPMNWRHSRLPTTLGGLFYRPETDAVTDTWRQRFYVSEPENPALSEDFYVVSEIHQKPFLDTENDPIEIAHAGYATVTGLTQFGPKLLEGSGSYEAVTAKVPTESVIVEE